MKKLLGSICVIVLVCGVAGIGNTTLIDRGGGLIYCDTLDVTWLQDASYSGQRDWDGAVAWADGLDYYDSARNVMWDDWRLPTALDENDETPTTREARGSEMGYLFYEELDGALWSSILSSSDPDLDLFENIQESTYWTSTFYGNYGCDYAWGTSFSYGFTRDHNENAPFYAWAVRDGDVGEAPVPEPSTWILLFLGLLGMVSIKKKFS